MNKVFDNNKIRVVLHVHKDEWYLPTIEISIKKNLKYKYVVHIIILCISFSIGFILNKKNK